MHILVALCVCNQLHFFIIHTYRADLLLPVTGKQVSLNTRPQARNTVSNKLTARMLSDPHRQVQ